MKNEEDAVREALLLWEDSERDRLEFLAEIDLAEASLDRGEGRRIRVEDTESWTAEICKRGRDRLAAASR